MRRPIVRRLMLTVLGLAACTTGAAQGMAPGAGLVLAESFEQPPSGNFTVVRAGQSFRTRNHVWQVEQASIDIVNTTVRPETASYDGRQVIDLAGSPGPGVMATRFATTPGQLYMLVVHYARNNGIGRTPAAARVEVVGNRLLLQQDLRHDPARMPFNLYREYRGTFRADATVSTLRFASYNAGNFGLVIDAVTVAGAGGGVPPPSDMAIGAYPQQPAWQAAPARSIDPAAAVAATAAAAVLGQVIRQSNSPQYARPAEPVPAQSSPPAETVAAAPGGMTGGSVEERFRGTWVPAAAGCGSPLRLTIEAHRVSFVNGGQRAVFTKLEQCYTCAAGAMQQNQPVWLTTDAMGDSPFTISMDGTRKVATVSVDFSNDEKLGARFPFGEAALRRCP